MENKWQTLVMGYYSGLRKTCLQQSQVLQLFKITFARGCLSGEGVEESQEINWFESFVIIIIFKWFEWYV